MERPLTNFSRRQVLQAMACGASVLWTPGVFAEELVATARMMEGPFYPDKMPLDTDNDLLLINNSITPAVGEITHLTGRILSSSGEPIRNAFVEIWQVDNNAAYLHSGTANRDKADKNFQGYGRFLTDSQGRYYFRTIKPVPYPGRPAPHIHFGVSRNGRRICTTQMLVHGHPGNSEDGLVKRMNDPAALKTVLADFKPIEGSRVKELAANFDIVLGVTPQDPHEDEAIQGGIGKPEGMGKRR